MFLGNLYKIFRGTVAGDDSGTPARTAAEGINSNMDAIDNALEAIDTNAEKKANKATNLDAPNNTSYPTTQAVKIATDAAQISAQNYGDAQLVSYQLKSEKGQANGYPDLDSNAKVPAAQTYGTIDEIIEGEYINATTFNDTSGVAVVGGGAKLYQDITTGNPTSGKQYRWSGSMFSNIASSPGTTDEVPEGGVNKYFTGARVLAAILTGYTIGNNAILAASDSVLAAFGKIQGQINALGTAIGAKLDKGSYNGTATDLETLANTKETPTGAQTKADTALTAAKDYANGLQGASIFVENFADLSNYVLEEDVFYAVRSENTVYLYDDVTALLYATRLTPAQFQDHEDRITILESSGGAAPIAYATMAAMYAAQSSQVANGNYRVDDASAHSEVEIGRAWFDYKGTTAGTEEDYILRSEEESLNLDAQLTAIENRLTAVENGKANKYGTRAVLAAAQIDWADGVDVHTKTITAALALTEINLPQGANVFIKKIIISGNFPVTMPGAHYVWKGGVAGGVSDAYVFDCINGNAGNLRVEYTITPNA